MRQEQKDLIKRAMDSGQPVLVGRYVCCDFCSEDYTDSPMEGGIVFESYGVCPKCTAKLMPEIFEANEQDGIRASCPKGMSFADWMRQIRGAGAAYHLQGLQ